MNEEMSQQAGGQVEDRLKPPNQERKTTASRLTRIPAEEVPLEIHLMVPIGNANKVLKLPNNTTFSIFRGSVANVMGVTIAQLLLGYYFEWDVKGGKVPVPTVLSDESDFRDMMQGVQSHRREQQRLLDAARAKKQNTTKFKGTPKVTLVDLREAGRAKVRSNSE